MKNKQKSLKKISTELTKNEIETIKSLISNYFITESKIGTFDRIILLFEERFVVWYSLSYRVVRLMKRNIVSSTKEIYEFDFKDPDPDKIKLKHLKINHNENK